MRSFPKIRPHEHEQWIDSWKGLLVFLVILGHVAGALVHSTAGSAHGLCTYLYKWIYLFHMPAFFFLAGYVAQRNHGKGPRSFRSFVASRTRRLLVPYFVLGLFSAAVFTLAMPYLHEFLTTPDGYYDSFAAPSHGWEPFVGLLHAGGWPNGTGFRCNSMLWFPPCLFMVQLADWTYRRWKNKSRLLKFLHLTTTDLFRSVCDVLFMLLSFALGGYLCQHPQVGGLPWMLDCVPYFLGFLYLGRLYFKLALRTSFALVLVGTVLFSLLVTAVPDLSCARSSWAWYGIELLMATAGCILSLGMARRFSGPIWPALGVNFLGILLLHKFPILAIQVGLSRLGILTLFAPVLLLLLPVAVLALTYALVRLIAKLKTGELKTRTTG